MSSAARILCTRNLCWKLLWATSDQRKCKGSCMCCDLHRFPGIIPNFPVPGNSVGTLLNLIPSALLTTSATQITPPWNTAEPLNHQDPLEVRRLNKEISKHPLRTEPPHHMMTPVHVHGGFSCYSHFALLGFVLRLLQSVTPTMSRNRSPGPPGFHWSGLVWPKSMALACMNYVQIHQIYFKHDHFHASLKDLGKLSNLVDTQTLRKAATAAKVPVSDVPNAWRYLEVVQVGRLRPGQNQRGLFALVCGVSSGPRTPQSAADRLWPPEVISSFLAICPFVGGAAGTSDLFVITYFAMKALKNNGESRSGLV